MIRIQIILRTDYKRSRFKNVSRCTLNVRPPKPIVTKLAGTWNKCSLDPHQNKMDPKH